VDSWSWLAVSAGTFLVVVILVDVFLTVLHIDRDGPVARRLHLGIWRATGALSWLVPRWRRGLLGLAGPLMITVTFGVWVAGYIVGFALVYWPFPDGFHFDSRPATFGFVDAVYFSGKTGSTLGYGDITPATPALQILAIVQGSLGFGLLSGAVTYLLNIVSGVTERNAMALRVDGETARSADGVEAVVRSMRYETADHLRDRFLALAHKLRGVQRRMAQFPILDLFYRSVDPTCDPERMVRALAEMAIAGQVLAGATPAARLRLASLDLGRVVADTMSILGEQYLDARVREQLAHPVPGPADLDYLDAVRQRLQASLELVLPADAEDRDATLSLTAQTRVFLDAIDRLTRWRADHPR
jgi:hypothetical protein